jgi:xanthine dehydrogenase YagR molybdenum-binding subunit
MTKNLGEEITGKPINRVDGRLKVTGTASYSAEFQIPDLAYGVVITSTITKGHINQIDTTTAMKLPGVINVLTYKNSLNLHFPQGSDPGSGKYAEKDLLPLQSDRIFYDGQAIAVVIAETFEKAEQAASLIKISYTPEEALIHLEKNLGKAYAPKSGLGGQQLKQKRGDPEQAMQTAQIKINRTYTTPVYHHNAMEPHATIAQWNGDELMVYDSTQSVYGSRNLLSNMLGVPQEKIRLVSLYIGGGFGSKGFSWPNTVMTCMAAKLVNRPVKLVLSRQQMFSTAGRRTQTIQQIQLGSDTVGKLSTLKHDTTSESSFVDEFTEPCGVASIMIYETPNASISHNIVRLNRGTPCPMRAPGEAPGSFAIEVAMDEMAEELKMDPIEFRLANYTETDPQKKKPFSSKYLRDCYARGAELIEWSKRSPVPGSVKQGNLLVGYGMATATYPANRSTSSAKAILLANGNVEIECCTQDIGTGTYTVMTQIAADALAMPVEKIKMKLGDSNYPKGANSGGSQVSASVGPAIRAASLGLIEKLIILSVGDQASPLYGSKKEDISKLDGRLFLKTQTDKGETYSDILSRSALPKLEAEAVTETSTREQTEASPPPAEGSKEAIVKEESKKNGAVQEDEKVNRKDYSFHSFGAQFVRVLVDPDLMTVHVDKAVAVMDIGKVLNLKTAKNQIMGGMIFGIGMALMEETKYDPNRGRVVTKDLANYLVPVHADMPEFEVEFLDRPDPFISPIGARGIGEIGITGMAAAVANAVFNATGKRVRDLPVTLDKLMI